MDELFSGREPSSRQGLVATRGWVTTGIIAMVLLLAAAGMELARQHAQLRSTRADLGNLKSALSQQGDRLNALESAVAKAATTADVPADLTGLAAKVTPAVVTVACASADLSDTGNGFGLALPPLAGSTTQIITAEHVIDGCIDEAGGISLAVIAGTQVVNAFIQGFDRDDDLAILGTSARLPVLHPSGDPVVGEFLMAVGHPPGKLNRSVTAGTISAVYDTTFVHTAAISNGNSGSPVVDRAGKVVGIVVAGAAPQANPAIESLNISLRLSTLCAHLLTGSACAALH